MDIEVALKEAARLMAIIDAHPYTEIEEECWCVLHSLTTWIKAQRN